MSERARWTRLGSRNPYWAVLDYDHYRSDEINEATLREFFASGERELSRLVEGIRRVWAPRFAPSSALDYGCGVGRLVIPMSRLADQVLGIDISAPMLEESARNCERQRVTNAAFLDADTFLRASDADFGFDFIHSNIVFQHIAPRVGLRITETLLRRLRPGGVAALQYTYAREASLLRRMVHPARRAFPPLNVAVNLVQGRPALEPMMPMHSYDLQTLLAVFARNGAGEVHAELTDHGGHKGAMFTFVKRG